MTNLELVDFDYKKAVAGLSETLLKDKEKWYKYVMDLPMSLKVTYTIVIFHQQVFNGGLHQYFFNTYGQFAYLTIEHLNLIKAYKTAEILNRALGQVNKDNYNIAEFRKKIYSRKLDSIVNFEEELFNFLVKLDKEYYHGDEDLEKLLGEYLSSVPEGSVPD